MPDYKNGKIYTIRCKTDETLIYVGSTIESLSSRLSKHRYSSKTNNMQHFYSKVENWDDWYIELYEDYPCERKEQLFKREGEVIREIGTLNFNIAGRNGHGWYEDNKKKVLEYHKTYDQENKEKIQKYKKEWAEKNKESIFEREKIKVTCEICNLCFRKYGIKRHNKSKYHLSFLE